MNTFKFLSPTCFLLLLFLFMFFYLFFYLFIFRMMSGSEQDEIQEIQDQHRQHVARKS